MVETSGNQPLIKVIDMEGLAKILDTEVAKRVYGDGLSAAVNESGSVLVDVVKGVRFFALPFALLGLARERIMRMLIDVTESVPPERRCNAPRRLRGRC